MTLTSDPPELAIAVDVDVEVLRLNEVATLIPVEDAAVFKFAPPCPVP